MRPKNYCNTVRFYVTLYRRRGRGIWSWRRWGGIPAWYKLLNILCGFLGFAPSLLGRTMECGLILEFIYYEWLWRCSQIHSVPNRPLCYGSCQYHCACGKSHWSFRRLLLFGAINCHQVFQVIISWHSGRSPDAGAASGCWIRCTTWIRYIQQGCFYRFVLLHGDGQSSS